MIPAKQCIVITTISLVLCQAPDGAASFFLRNAPFFLPTVSSSAWAEDAPSRTPEIPPAAATAAPFLMPDLWTMPTGSRQPEAMCVGPLTETPPAPLLLQDMNTCPTGSEPLPEEGPPAPPETAGKPGESGKQWGFFDSLHGAISRQLLSTADWLDSFFADPVYLKEVNRSYARFRYDLFQENYAKAAFKPAFDVRLVLPQLERKTHLVFSATPAESPTDKTPARTVGERLTAPEQQNITTAMQYVFRTAPKESFAVLSGLQFSNLKPVVFLTPRYRALMPYMTWAVRFTQELQWKSDTEWQTDTRIDVERPFPRNLFFRTSLDGVWLATSVGYYYSLSFLLRHPLDPSHAFEYEMINNFQTEPSNELTEFALNVRYRQSFWRSWFFFDVDPQVRFPRDKNFRIIPGILFRIEVLFGPPA